MQSDVLVLLIILAAAFAAFIRDRWPPAAIAVATLLALTATGLVSGEQAVAGFASEAVIAIGGLLVLGEALVRTGVVRWMAGQMERAAGSSRRRLLLIGTAAPGIMSGFINIVAAVSVFIPALLRIALHRKLRPSRLMLPMAAVAMAGANLTLIGASHNLVVDDLICRDGEGFGFFEFTPVGLTVVALALLYALSVGRYLLPKAREPVDERGQEARLFERYALDGCVWEVAFEPGRQREGAGPVTLGDLAPGKAAGVQVALIRRGDRVSEPTSTIVLEPQDLLVVIGRESRVRQWVDDEPRVELHGQPEQQGSFGASSAELVEVMIPPRSRDIGKTAREMALRDEHGLVAIGLWRDGKPHHDYVRETTLRAGDALLLYGDKRHTRGFDEREADLFWLHEPSTTEAPRSLRHLGKWTALIFVAVVLAAVFDLVPIAFGALAGAVAVGLLGVMNGERAFAAIDWPTLVLIAAMWPLGAALDNSGAGELLATWITDALGGLGPYAVLAAFAALAALLTQFLHNAVVAVSLTPVAIALAGQMQVEVKTFAVALIVAASVSVMLPIGHPAPLLVKDPGGYRVADYLRFGTPLVVLVVVMTSLVVPWFFPFE